MTYKRKEKTIRRNTNLKSTTDYEPYVSDSKQTIKGIITFVKRLKVYEPVSGESIILGAFTYAELNEDNQKVYIIPEETIEHYTVENWLEELLQKYEAELNSDKSPRDNAKNRYLARLLAQKNNSEDSADNRMFKRIAAPKSRRKQLLAKAAEKDAVQEELEVVSYAEGLAKRQGRAEAVTSVKESDGELTLLNHTLNYTGIEQHLTKIYTAPIAKKLISCAFYTLLSDRSLRELDVYQAFHNLPYEKGVPPDVIYELLTEIGKLENQGKMKSFFSSAMESVGQSPIIAADSTTTGTYSKYNNLARYGHAKACENLPIVKNVVIYSVINNYPISYDLVPGNMADVTLLDNVLKNLDVYGFKDVDLLLDNGFISQSNLKMMFERGIKFTAVAKQSDSWIKEIAHSPCNGYATAYEALDDFSNHLDGINPATHGVVVASEITFDSNNKIVSQTAKRKEGEEYTTYPIWVGFFKDYSRYSREYNECIKSCNEIILNLETGTEAYEDLTQGKKNKFKKLYNVQYDAAGNLQISKRKEPLHKLLEDLGTFCIITSKEIDARILLLKYRLRARIEGAFRESKQKLFGSRTYTGNEDQLRGREFVRLLALIIDISFDKLVDRVRIKSLEYSNTKPTKNVRDEYKAIYKWVANRRPAEVLNWFKEVRNVHARSKYAQAALTEDCTKRDTLFLELFIEVAKETNLAADYGEICLFDE